MTITNGLCTLAEFKSAARLIDTVDDVMLEPVIEAASRMIEAHCGRRFYADSTATARVFAPLHNGLAIVDDFHTTTDLVVKTDPNLTGTYSETWTAADYQLEPLNGLRDGVSWPYNSIRALGAYLFPTALQRATVQVTAKWGFAAVPTDVKVAALIQSEALFKAYDAPLGVAGIGDMGVMRMRQALHPSAAALLERYRLIQTKVG